MSGLQKEDMDANTLEKLERHNVNMHDMNNATLRQECFGQSISDTESSTQQIDIFGDQNVAEIAITDKSYKNVVATHTQNTSHSSVQTYDMNNETWYLDQVEKEKYTNEKLKLQNDSEQASYVRAKNKMKKYNEIAPTLENIVQYWNKYKNNSFYINDILAVPVTSTTTETSANPNYGLLRPSDMEYVKGILGRYLANRNISTSQQNTTTGQDNGNFISQKYLEMFDNTEKIQGSIGNNSPFPYNIGQQMTKVNNDNKPTIDRTQRPQIEDFIDTNTNLLNEGSTDIEPQILFGKPNKLSVRPKHEPILVSGPNHEDINSENLIKNVASSLHTNKRELNDVLLHKTNLKLVKELSSATEIYPKITDIGQSSHKNEREIHNDSLFVDKPPISNNNYIEESEDTTNTAKLEDWYKKMFTDDMAISPSLTSNNNQKESLFDTTYTFNKEHALKSKQTQDLDKSPMRGNNKSRQMFRTMPYVELDSEVFDINSVINYNYRATETSKDVPYSDFYLKGFNPDFLSNIASPSRDNDEENVSTFDPKQLINNNKEAVARNSLLTNNPKLDFNVNSPKNNQFQNKEATLGLNHLGNNDYEQFEGLIDVPSIRSKQAPENFISSFRKTNVAQPVKKGVFLNNNVEYIEVSNETTLPKKNQTIKPIANIGQQRDNLYVGDNQSNIIMNEAIKVKEVIPPFLENNMKDKNIFIESNTQPINKHDKAANDIHVFAVGQSRNNTKSPKHSLNTVIQGDKLRLIKNSLQYINQILAMNEEVNSPSISDIVNTTIRNKIQPAQLNVIKQRKHKTMTKTMIESNHGDLKELKMLQGVSTDFIKAIAESVKDIIFKDIREKTTYNSTTLLATTITTVETTVSTTEITTTETKIQDELKTNDANYVVQKILELFTKLRTGTVGTTSTTLKPKIFQTHVSKYVYSPSKNDQPPPMPAFNPYGMKPEIIQTNFANSYNQVYGNPVTNLYKDSYRPQMANQTSQMIKQSPRMSIQLGQQMTNQAPRIMNHQLQMLNKPPQPMGVAAPQNIYHYPPIINQRLQNIYHFPKILNNEVDMLNQQSQMINQAPQMVEEKLSIVNTSPQILDQHRQILNPARQTLNQLQELRNQVPQTFNNSPEIYNLQSQMFNQGPQIIKDTPQMYQPSKIMNHAQQMLNEALQMKNQESQLLNDCPEMPNQSPQLESHPQQMSNQELYMRNQPLQLMNNYPEMMNQRQKYSISSPQILNLAPQTMFQSSETTNPQPQITAPLTNAMKSYHYVTFQSNANEIPPLGIPMENPKSLINQVIVVTTKRQFVKPKYVREQEEMKKRSDEKRKEKEQNHSKFTNKLGISDSLKNHEFKEPSKYKSSKHRVNAFYKNFTGNQREPYKPRYKSPDYGRARSPHHSAVKKFHEQLERTEDWSEPDQKRSRERIKDSYGDVTSRQQVPLAKVKQRSRYDDTHFRNFLKTQEKVNDMLEAILATKTSGRPHSVETP